MGATSIRSRITDLLKELTIDSTAIGQFATDSAKEIINMFKKKFYTIKLDVYVQCIKYCYFYKLKN